MITILTYNEIQTCRIYLSVIILYDDIKGVYLGKREIKSMLRFTKDRDKRYPGSVHKK